MIAYLLICLYIYYNYREEALKIELNQSRSEIIKDRKNWIGKHSYPYLFGKILISLSLT